MNLDEQNVSELIVFVSLIVIMRHAIPPNSLTQTEAARCSGHSSARGL